MNTQRHNGSKLPENGFGNAGAGGPKAKAVCAWCAQEQGVTTWPEGTSHGICRKHYALALADLAASH